MAGAVVGVDRRDIDRRRDGRGQRVVGGTGTQPRGSASPHPQGNWLSAAHANGTQGSGDVTGSRAAAVVAVVNKGEPLERAPGSSPARRFRAVPVGERDLATLRWTCSDRLFLHWRSASSSRGSALLDSIVTASRPSATAPLPARQPAARDRVGELWLTGCRGAIPSRALAFDARGFR
jgi:hypothetical protein